MRRLAVVVAAGAALWLAPGAFAAGWCGGGETSADRPDVTTGQQVHAVYAVPADGTDNFAAVANKMADDVTSMTTWWTGQDPTRTPRFDAAVFPAGTCLDISFYRLPDPASVFQGATNAFNRVVTDLFNAGFDNQFKKYYVYYDGPSVEANLCGTGGGSLDSGPGYAIVWLAGCPGVPTDAVGTHELTHAFGAVPATAPHACQDGHVCDSTSDLMYPTTSGQPLSQLLLDYNHDDYYGLSSGGIDIRNSLWLRHLDAPQQPLTVTIAGAGTVTSDVPGVDCTVTCTTQWDQGWAVNLDATPAAGHRFIRWTGACAGSDLCTLQVSQPTSVAALFGPLRIPVKVTTAGRGRIVCTPACSKSFPAGNRLVLRAVAAKGWRFVRWSGACTGTRLTCSPPTDFAVSARATFRKR